VAYFYIDEDNKRWLNSNIRLSVNENGNSQSTLRHHFPSWMIAFFMNLICKLSLSINHKTTILHGSPSLSE